MSNVGVKKLNALMLSVFELAEKYVYGYGQV